MALEILCAAAQTYTGLITDGIRACPSSASLRDQVVTATLPKVSACTITSNTSHTYCLCADGIYAGLNYFTSAGVHTSTCVGEAKTVQPAMPSMSIPASIPGAGAFGKLIIVAVHTLERKTQRQAAIWHVVQEDLYNKVQENGRRFIADEPYDPGLNLAMWTDPALDNWPTILEEVPPPNSGLRFTLDGDACWYNGSTEDPTGQLACGGFTLDCERISTIQSSFGPAVDHADIVRIWVPRIRCSI